MNNFDCTTRMFLSCLCFTTNDLRTLGVLGAESACCVSAETRARSVLHRLLQSDQNVAAAVTDMLDLRFADLVAYVQSSELTDISCAATRAGREGVADELIDWAWALLRDGRPEVVAVGRCLMGECYVRGIRSLAMATVHATGLGVAPEEWR